MSIYLPQPLIFYTWAAQFQKMVMQDEIGKNGGNSSMIHVDWMIGSDAISIDGLDQEGRATPIFRTGEWAL